MASFIKKIKQELIKTQDKGDCCSLALLYGVIFSSGSVVVEGGEKYLEITTSCNELFEKINEITTNIYGQVCELSINEDSIMNHTTYQIRMPLLEAKVMLEDLEILKSGKYDFSFNNHIIENDCCKVSFLKGVFLATANSTIKFSDEKQNLAGYHLEFVLSSEEKADLVSQLLAEFGMIERTIYRGNFAVVYLSDYDSILSLVGLFGASKTYLELENENATRDLKKQLNRQLNFVNANLNKQSEVSAKQISAIREIDEVLGLNNLPEKLCVVAKARLENPELSLGDLITKLNEKVSKSGINHRMRKLMEIHKNLKN